MAVEGENPRTHLTAFFVRCTLDGIFGMTPER